MQKFFESNMVTDFIANLVANAPLPIIKSANNHSYIVNSQKYLYNKQIIECTQTGYIEKTIGLADDAPIAKYRIIEPYALNRVNKKLESRYISHNNYYDAETHFQLGERLRFWRDDLGIDLMPFYNCYNYKTIQGSIQPKVVNNNQIFLYNPKSYNSLKLFAIPIKFDQTYTVALDCYATTYISAILYDDQGELHDSNGAVIYECPAKKYHRMSFVNPITVRFNSNYNQSLSTAGAQDNLVHLEKHLYMLIQVPSTTQSSLVVLEGNYLHHKKPLIINAEVNDITELNETLVSNLQLLLINDKNSYAFSDRLVEHLLHGVIGPTEDIYQNITRVQDMAKMTKEKDYIPGVWTKQMRIDFFNHYLNNKYESPSGIKIDTNGYVNKDVEIQLLRGEF